MKVVFIHGRSQEGKSPTVLQDAWAQAMTRGFAAASLAPPGEWEIVFPYYGDLLFRLTEDVGRESFNTLVDRGAAAAAPPAEEQEFMQELVFAIAEAKGISLDAIAKESAASVVERGIQNWKAVLAALRLLDRVEGVGQTSIELFTRDVWYYLTKKGLRLRINEVVDNAIPTSEPCVLVAHSLGTVVAYNLLMNRAELSNVKGLVTIGSPLGIEAIYSRLPSDVTPRKAPEGLASWFNARDPQDTVALYEISSSTFRGVPVVVNYSGAENRSDNHHGIVQYLEDRTIAKAIYGSARV
jgi:hypothetical protein